jgi:hypothetical protein
MDEDLGRILLEGGGGGQMRESYELAMYFMARHTSIDCYDKRGRRGYLFIIGDEKTYSKVKRQEVLRVIGDQLEADIPTRQIVSELTRRYDTYYILPSGSCYSGNQEVIKSWRALLGQNVLELDDLDAACETIALTVGLGEDSIDLEQGLADLEEFGSATAASTVSQALAPLSAARGTTVVASLPGIGQPTAALPAALGSDPLNLPTPRTGRGDNTRL